MNVCTNVVYAASAAGGATRLADYQRERSAPDLLCVSRTHDRDASWLLPPRRGDGEGEALDESDAVDASAGPAARHRAWCPPEGAEYPGWGAAAVAPAPSDVALEAATPTPMPKATS